jgi:hypothetical protein
MLLFWILPFLFQHSLLYRKDNAHEDSIWSCAWGRMKKKDDENVDGEGSRYTLLKSIVFWDMTPCSQLSVNRCFGGTYRLYLQGRRNQQASWWFLAELISSTQKMEAICSSGTSVETQRATPRPTPENDTLHNHRCENLKSYIRF